MPNAKRSRKTRRRPEPGRMGIPSCAAWMLREVIPHLRAPKLPRTRSVRHLRNATIEVLEAMRAVLDEVIEWLRHEGRLTAELKRIRVEG